MDDKVKTWVKGEMVDLTEARKAELAQEALENWSEPKPAPTVKGPNRPLRKRMLDTLIGADNPAYPYVELLLQWGWVPFAGLLVAGFWMRGCSIM